MSDYHNYYENLAFPPQPIKSQDNLPKQCRKTVVLIEAIEKAEQCLKQAQEAEEKLLKIKRILQRKNTSYESKVINIYSLVKDL